MHAAYWPATDILCNTPDVVGFTVGAFDDALTARSPSACILAYMGLVVQIIWPIRGLGRLIAEMSTGFVAIIASLEIMRVDREPLDEPAALKNRFGRYTAHSHSKTSLSLIDGKNLLHNISFAVESGANSRLYGQHRFGKPITKTKPAAAILQLSGRTHPALTVSRLTDYPRGYLRQHIGIVQQGRSCSHAQSVTTYVRRRPPCD